MKPVGGWPAALVCAVSGGVLLWAVFPPVGWGYLAPVGIALVVLPASGASIVRGFTVGLIAGWAAYLPMLTWLQVVGLDAWFLLASLCALWLGVFGAGTALITRLTAWPLWVLGSAALWVLVEGLRSRYPWGGFAWGRVAFAQADTALGPTSALIGMAGVSFLAAVAGALIVAVARAWRAGGGLGARAPLTCLGCVGLVVMAVWVARPIWMRTDPASTTATIAVVQGGTPQTGMGAMDVRRAVVDNHLQQTGRLGSAARAGMVAAPDLIVWPENSSDLDPFVDGQIGARISDVAGAVGAPILVGAVLEVPDDPRHIRNAGIVWDPSSGPGEVYVKRYLVPFGEFVPYRDVIAQFIDRLDRVSRDFLPGDKPGNLVINRIPVGLVICFEVSSDSVVRDVVLGGAQVITVQTNNATFAGTAQPAQQLQIERMRAIESGRVVAVAATSGISAFIDDDGHVLQELDESQTGFMVERVALTGRILPGVLIGGWVEAILGLLALGTLVGASLLRSRSAQGRQSDSSAPRTVG